jgi:bifunctional non-homologous end joining protein LigD
VTDTALRAGRRRIRISSPGKVLFPEDGITKLELAQHYADVEAVMRPHVDERPLNLWRWNAGIHGERIVQQEAPRGLPEWVRTATVSKRGGGAVSHVVGGPQVCVALAQLNCITPHAWTSRADRSDQPDRIIFDLDPPEGVDFHTVREAALAMGELLRSRGLEPFAMTTGSKGIHVVAPLRRGRPAPEVREAARELGAALAAEHPDTLTTEWRKDKRDGRILVDTARNTYAQTVVAPYAVRALPGAPVATPLEWPELRDPQLTPRRWTLRTIGARLAERGDPWADIRRAARALPRG